MTNINHMFYSSDSIEKMEKELKAICLRVGGSYHVSFYAGIDICTISVSLISREYSGFDSTYARIGYKINSKRASRSTIIECLKSNNKLLIKE
jgi:hypothetical protein